MKKFSVPCPSVVALKKHVLVMSFIGKDGHPAPKLKDAKLSPENLQDAFDQTVQVSGSVVFVKVGFSVA